MQNLLEALVARRTEIASKRADLEKYLQEAHRLENELRHIDALLRIHRDALEQSNCTDFSRILAELYLLPFNDEKKIPSGIARHIITLLASTSEPLAINKIHQLLKEKGIDVTISGVNTALRRNVMHFEQVDKFFWRIKTDNIKSAGKQDDNLPKVKARKEKVATVG